MTGADLSNFDASQYELLCVNRETGGRDTLSNYPTCNIAMAPSRTWLSAKDFLSDVSIAHTPLSLAQLLDTRTDLFNIYGEFLKNNNVIFNVSLVFTTWDFKILDWISLGFSFQNAAKGLATVENLDFEKFKSIHDVISSCGIA